MNQPEHTLPLIWAVLPYAGTLAGVYVLDRGLVAVGIYHLGILAAWILTRFPPRVVFCGLRVRMLLCMGGLCLLTWPALYILWPWMKLPGVDLATLLSDWRLTGPVVWVFAIYSVTLHPVLEETFWRGMLPDRKLCDALFAGFHLLVLAPLIQAVWLPLVFVSLLTASAIWRVQVRRTGGLLIPVLTHAIADLGIVLAVSQLVLTG